MVILILILVAILYPAMGVICAAIDCKINGEYSRRNTLRAAPGIGWVMMWPIIIAVIGLGWLIFEMSNWLEDLAEKLSEKF